MKLVDNWRAAWRMVSVQLATVAIAFGLMAPDTQAAVLDLIGVPANRITAVLGLLFLVGRLVAQPKVQGEEKPPA